jgi:hypothetical protein
MGKGFWLVFGLSVFFGLGFAVGGAGIFGSPFASVLSNWPSPEVHRQQRLMLMTILIGPAACLAALLAHCLGARAASAILILGAIAVPILSCLTPFRELTILVGPAACLAALLAHSLRARGAASAILVLGAIAGAILGCLTPFRVVWEKVFLVLVWGPMIFVGITLLTPKSPPT